MPDNFVLEEREMQITDVPNGYIHLGKSRCRDASSRGVVAGKASLGTEPTTSKISKKKDQSMSKRMLKKMVSSSWDDYILIELKFFLNLVFFPLLYQKSDCCH